MSDTERALLPDVDLDITEALKQLLELPIPGNTDSPPRKITRTWLAEQMELKPHHLAKFFNGQTEPRPRLIAQMEAACGLPRGWLLTAAGYVEIPQLPEESIALDWRLSPEYRTVLTDMYRGVIERLGQADAG